MSRRSWIVRGGLAVAAWLVLVVVFDFSALKSVLAIVAFAALLRGGYAILRPLAHPPPPPPEPGTMRKVKLNYRCGICGAEVRMTAAVSEDPEPPRHCMEDMDLLNPQE